MRYYRHLPPFLRVVSVFGLALLISSLVLFVALFAFFVGNHVGMTSRWPEPPDDSRVSVIGLNMLLLGNACTAVVNTYTKRFRQPSQGPLPLTSWQSQARAIALMAMLPLCAIVLAALISPARTLFGLVFAVSLLAAIALLGAHVALMTSSSC